MGKKPPFNPDEFIDVVAKGNGSIPVYVAEGTPPIDLIAAGEESIPAYLAQHAPPTEEDFAAVLDRVGYMLQDIAGWGNALYVADYIRMWIGAMWSVHTMAVVSMMEGDNDA